MNQHIGKTALFAFNRFPYRYIDIVMQFAHFVILSIILSASSADFTDIINDLENMVYGQPSSTGKPDKMTSIIKEIEDMVYKDPSKKPAPLTKPITNFNLTDAMRQIDDVTLNAPHLIPAFHNFLRLGKNMVLGLPFNIAFKLFNTYCKPKLN